MTTDADDLRDDPRDELNRDLLDTPIVSPRAEEDEQFDRVPSEAERERDRAALYRNLRRSRGF